MAWYWWILLLVFGAPILFAASMAFCYWRMKSIERQMEEAEPGSVNRMKAARLAGEIARRLGISLPAATAGIKRLEESGVVRDRSGRGRRRIYAAEEVINLLSRPFGAEIDVAFEGARSLLKIPS